MVHTRSTFVAAPAERSGPAASPSSGCGIQPGPYHLLINAQADLAGTQAVLPLDEDPLTLATINFANWLGYERSDAGMVVPLGLGEPKFKVEYLWGRQYRNGPITAKIELVKPTPEGAESQDDRWDQPYLIVAKLGSYVQHMYPRNTKAYPNSHSGWGFDSFCAPAFQRTPYADQLQLTAVFPDGQRYTETVTIAYQEGEYRTAADRRKRLQKNRRDHAAAWRMPQRTKEQRQRRLSALHSASYPILLSTTDVNEGRRVYNQMVGLNPGRDEVDSLRYAWLHSSLSQRQTKLSCALLKSLRQSPSDHSRPTETFYLQCAWRLVGKDNDFAKAREVIQWCRQDRPKMPWRPRGKDYYGSVLATPLPLPKDPIRP